MLHVHKQIFMQQALALQREHSRLHPGYKYRPKRRRSFPGAPVLCGAQQLIRGFGVSTTINGSDQRNGIL